MSNKTLVKVGKLYSCEDYFLMLYTDCKSAAAFSRPYVGEYGSAIAFYQSRELGKPVSCLEKNMPLLVLSFKGKGKYVEVLAGEQKGWIANPYILKEID